MYNPRVLVLETQAQLEAEMAAVGVDPLGARIMAPKSQFRVVKVEGLRTAAASILKQEMLAKGGEAALSWSSVVGSSETTDVLLMGSLRQFRRLLQRLRVQPLKLRSLSDEIRAALDGFDGFPRPMNVGNATFEWGQRTYVMGIINVTPDSFSGDGVDRDLEAIVAQARRMVDEGADLLDLGGESTRPGHDPVSLEDEMYRVLPALRAVLTSVEVPVSVDTYKAQVAEAALEIGAHMVNDIWGFKRDPEMAGVVARAGVPVVLMHNQEGTDYVDLMGDIVRALRQSVELALKAGVDEDKIIVDPGIGFGKRRTQNLEVLARLAELRSLGRPLLLGASRKSTIGHILGTPADDRLEGTAATVALGVASGTDIMRVHDVKEMARVAKIADAIVRGRWQEYS